MARKNRFANKTLAIKAKDRINSTSTMDGLPALDFSNNEARYYPIRKGEKEFTVIFNSDTHAEINNLTPRQSKGLIVSTWFPSLHEHNSNIAIEIARIFIKRFSNKNFHSSSSYCFSILAIYIVNNKLKSLNELNFNHLTKLSESINRTRTTEVFNGIKEIIGLSVTANKYTKSLVKSFDPSTVTRGSIKTSDDAKARIDNWRKSLSYSDYVMFQIYAYVNAGIQEISETHERVYKYKKSGNYPSFFKVEGTETFKKLVTSNDESKYEQAYTMALCDTLRVNNAMWLIKSNLSKPQYQQFKTGVINLNYDSFPSSDWPLTLQEDKDVNFLCQSVLPPLVANSRQFAENFFVSGGYISFANIASRWLSSWNKGGFKYHYQQYKKYIHQTSIMTTLFDIKIDSCRVNTTPLMLGYTAHYDFLLEVLIIAESGRNKEVIESIPSRSRNGNSVLKNTDRFASEPSALLTGKKIRGHVKGGGKQLEDLSIPHNTPLYRHLKLFDDIRQLSQPSREKFFNGPSVINKYQKVFARAVQIKEKGGKLINSIDTTKFRKVFAGEILQQWMKKIKNKDDLIRAVAADLKNTIPLHYLLQSSNTEDMLSTAIVALQTKFIEHHQRIAVRLITPENELNSNRNKNEPRFLCDCIDPLNPDYAENLDVSFCKQFDHCLGCSKSEVYQEHLPKIIYRIFQYEEILRINKNLYDANYAIKHFRAKSVVDAFIEKIDDGEKIRAEAALKAYEAWDDPDNYLLPPLLHSNI